jgi:YHS domain-containing protein
MRTILNLMALVALAMPAMAQDHDHKAHENSEMKMAPTAQTTCPVSGEKLEDKELFVDYEGQRVYLCCKKCVKKFNAFPDKFIATLAKNGESVQNIQTTCPVSGEELEDDAISMKFGDKSIKVCCKKCAKKVKANPVAYFDKLEGRKAQEKCAVMGGTIKPENFFVINGTRIDQCCPGCEKKWRADPDKYFAKLAAQKVVLEPASNRCPVMPGMAVKDRQYPVTLGARRFYFCSEGTRQKFLADPAKYMKNLDKMPVTGPPPAPKMDAKKMDDKAMPAHKADGHDHGANDGHQN